MISIYRRLENSWLHRQRAGYKLLALCFISALIFPLNSLEILVFLCLLSMMVYMSLGAGGLKELKVICPLWPWFAVMWIFHAFDGHYAQGTIVVLKMILMISLANLLTLTTRQSDLLATIEAALAPLSWIGVTTRPLSISVSLMIRFVPVLLVQFNQHQQAWSARLGGKLGRWHLLVPALLAAMRLSQRVSESLWARGGVRGLR